MADEIKEDQKEMFLKPAVTALRVIGLMFDVGTMVLRLMLNTLLYDTPHGKLETVEGRARE